MSLKQYQKQVDTWAQQFAVPYWQPLEMMTRLCEETGELARELNHRFGPKQKKSSEDVREVGEEISDIFFTLICLANSQGIDLDEAFVQMMAKIEGRDATRFAKK